MKSGRIDDENPFPAAALSSSGQMPTPDAKAALHGRQIIPSPLGAFTSTHESRVETRQHRLQHSHSLSEPDFSPVSIMLCLLVPSIPLVAFKPFVVNPEGPSRHKGACGLCKRP